MPDFPPIIHYAIPFFVFAMLFEFFITIKKNIKSYTAKDAFSSIAMGLGNVFIGFVSKLIVFAALYYVYENFRFFSIPVTWWSFILLFFLDDLSYYWFHRISHENRLFWASHVVHHSSKHYNLSTALRQTWTGGFYSFIFLVVATIDRLSSWDDHFSDGNKFIISILDPYRINKKNAQLV